MSSRSQSEDEDESTCEMLSDISSAINAFSLDLYTELTEQSPSENIFFSPTSISLALGMTYLGARKKTGKQMSDVLHFTCLKGEGEERGNPHLLLKYLQDELNGSKTDDYLLYIANRLYVQQDFSIRKSYVEAVEGYYNSTVEKVDFVQSTEKARRSINKWVKKMTNDKISELIASGALSNATRLVIVNAIYFKGDWEYQFKESNTKYETYSVDADTKMCVRMMCQSRRFRYGHSKRLRAKLLELPYKGSELSMIILLPDKTRGLAKLECQLTSETMDNLWEEFGVSRRETLVKLPKFKTEASFMLEKTLPEMGMRHLFDPGRADLSGISRDSDLYVSSVIHKAYLNVDEEGSEAAAATGVVVALTSMPIMKERETFIVDHPFLFLIRENENGSILFMGRVIRPQAPDQLESKAPRKVVSWPDEEAVETCPPQTARPSHKVKRKKRVRATQQMVPAATMPVTMIPAATLPPATLPVAVLPTPNTRPREQRHVTKVWVEPTTFNLQHPPIVFPRCYKY